MPRSPDEVFRANGLGASRWLRVHSQATLFSTAETAAKLIESLVELGGLYRAFGQFLRWRADLLAPEYRDALRNADLSRDPLPFSTAVSVLRRDLGAASTELERSLESRPLWSTLSRTAWKARWKADPVVVQIVREPVSEAELRAFEKSIRHLGHHDLVRVQSPVAMKQFREWIRAESSGTRERAYLEVLNRNREHTLARYPEPISEASAGQVLVWRWVEGRDVAGLIRNGNREAVVAAATAVLEQFCSLSVVEGDLDARTMVIDGQGRLTFRRIGCPIAVPPAMLNGGMKYIAAVLAGSDSLAAEQLSFLAAGAFHNETARDLVEAFSGVEPELKIRLWFPPSAQTMENNWRALEHLGLTRQLFLDCIQRNLSLLGYWNADAVANGAARFDAIVEAQWAVIGRLMRAQAGDLATPSKAAEWVMGAGMLMFGAAKEMNRLAEELRDNNLTLGLDIAPLKHDRQQQVRNWLSGSAMAVVLTGLLAVIRWGPMLAGGWRAVAVVFAASAVFSLFWLVSRLG
jgi:hypothetical protein